MKSSSLRVEAAKLAAAMALGAATFYFARAEPWAECASRAVEINEFGRPIRPSEDFMLPPDYDKRMEKVRQADREIKEGNVPAYVTRMCGPKPEAK